jgi:DNA-binding HxlR family transcriptional regulator/putative sterol carrier protein
MHRTSRYDVRMATMRTYGDGCAIAHGLDLVGERWALLVVRELILGPKRYTDLRRGLPNASPNVLSERLRELEEAGVVRRRKLPPPAGSRVYELTDWGRGLEEIVISLGHWGARSPSGPSDAPVGVDSMILALRSRFDPGAAHGLRAGYELRLGEDRFRIKVADDELEVARGGADQADATIDTDPDTLGGVLWGGRSLADAQRSGKITIEGDKATVERFVRLFPMPEPAAAVSPA